MAATLPTDIITDILSRLPAESLLDFKCVSKSWYSLINSPNFIKLHLNQTLISDSHRNLLLTYSNHSPDANVRRSHLLCSDIDLNRNHLQFFELRHPLNHREINFLGSCNGVVFFSDKSTNDAFLCNPITGSCRKLPPNINSSTRGKAEVFGFGFDSENDDYKVLRLLQDTHYTDSELREAEVYSLKNNSWRRVRGMEYYLLFLGRHGVYLNDAVHYVVVTKELQMSRKFIVGFDFKTETYSLMDCPDYEDKLDGWLEFGELGGCLSLLVMYRTLVLTDSPLHFPGDEVDYRMDRADLWVMKEYGNVESWVRMFSIRHTASVGMYLQIRTLVYSRDKSRILLEVDFMGLGWYDLDTHTFDAFRGVPKAPISSRFVVGSLVSVGNDKLKFEGGVIVSVGNDKLKSEGGVTPSVPKKNTQKKNLDNFLSTGFKLKL